MEELLNDLIRICDEALRKHALILIAEHFNANEDMMKPYRFLSTVELCDALKSIDPEAYRRIIKIDLEGIDEDIQHEVHRKNTARKDSEVPDNLRELIQDYEKIMKEYEQERTRMTSSKAVGEIQFDADIFSPNVLNKNKRMYTEDAFKEAISQYNKSCMKSGDAKRNDNKHSCCIKKAIVNSVYGVCGNANCKNDNNDKSVHNGDNSRKDLLSDFNSMNNVVEENLKYIRGIFNTGPAYCFILTDLLYCALSQYIHDRFHKFLYGIASMPFMEYLDTVIFCQTTIVPEMSIPTAYTVGENKYYIKNKDDVRNLYQYVEELVSLPNPYKMDDIVYPIKYYERIQMMITNLNYAFYNMYASFCDSLEIQIKNLKLPNGVDITLDYLDNYADIQESRNRCSNLSRFPISNALYGYGQRTNKSTKTATEIASKARETKKFTKGSDFIYNPFDCRDSRNTAFCVKYGLNEFLLRHDYRKMLSSLYDYELSVNLNKKGKENGGTFNRSARTALASLLHTHLANAREYFEQFVHSPLVLNINIVKSDVSKKLSKEVYHIIYSLASWVDGGQPTIFRGYIVSHIIDHLIALIEEMFRNGEEF